MKDKQLLIYLAGLFDGEGCIKINKGFHKARKNRFARYQYQVQCTVSNTNPTAVRLFEKEFGGSVHISHDVENYPKHRTTWCWSVSCKKAENFLKEIKKYLRLKKDEAEVALKFRKTIFPKKEWNNHKMIITEQHDKIRDSYKKDLELLKQQRYLM